MASVIFDTNIYIFHSLRYPDALRAWEEQTVTNNCNHLMSIIQVSELLSYSEIDKNPMIRSQREKYISLADEIVVVDDEIARKAAELRRSWNQYSGKTLKLPDALIAATAIVKNAILFGNNDRDFLHLSKFHELQYQNPIENQENLAQFLREKKASTSAKDMGVSQDESEPI